MIVWYSRGDANRPCDNCVVNKKNWDNLDVHQTRVRVLPTKASRRHTRRLRLEHIKRPLRAQPRTHGTERADRALLLHKRHRAPAIGATTTADGKLDAEPHGLLHEVACGRVVRVFEARA
jgi:hypothetical protein